MKTKLDCLRTRALLLAVPLLAARTSVAQLQETFTSPTKIDYSNDYGDFGSELSFPQFDPSLGALTSVTLSLPGNYEWDFFVDAPITYTDSQTTGPVTTTMTMGLSVDGLNASVVSSVTQNYSINGYDSFEVLGVEGAGSSETTTSDAATLASFTGTGSIIIPGTDSSWSLTGSTPPGSDGYFAGAKDGAYGLAGSVTYNYSVPDQQSVFADIGLIAALILIPARFRHFKAN